MSPAEVARLLDHAPGLKARAALSLAYVPGNTAGRVAVRQQGSLGARVHGHSRKSKLAVFNSNAAALLYAAVNSSE